MEIAETTTAPTIDAASPREKFDWSKVTNSPAFIPGLWIFIGVIAAFWTLMTKLVPLWKDNEYYSHGFLVPLISGYIVYRRWDRLSLIPVKTGWVALPFFLLTMLGAYVGHRMEVNLLLSVCLIGSLLTGAWFVAGGRWMLGLAAPILYLVFALPVWSNLIDQYTMPLQKISTLVAFQLLKLFGLNPFLSNETFIYLSNYQLDVGIPCSGLKLVLALSAFAVFFMLVARLKLWANLVFAASVLPLALFINGLRISLIGVVGNAYGSDAGAAFHDYSGYITLIVCFFILFKGAKLLGWKD